jgi:hypothetical protein
MNEKPLKLHIVRRYNHIEQGGGVYWTAVLPCGSAMPLSWPNSIAAFQGVRRWWAQQNCNVQIQF